MAVSKKAGDHDVSSKMLKTQEKGKTTTDVKTIRFQLALAESNEKTCPELNYRELVEAELKKKATKKLANSKDGSAPMDVDDEERVAMEALARKFEEKYGGSTKPQKKKKGKRNEDYVDLGAGYDESDPFIDNTEVYDEIVPCEMTTAQGGFYINCGALEFKQVEVAEPPSDDDDQIKARKKKNSTAAIDSESSSDDDDESDDEDDSSSSSDESADGKDTEKEAKEASPTQPAAATNGVAKPAEKVATKPLEKPSVKPQEKPAPKPQEKPPKPIEKPPVKAVEIPVIANSKEAKAPVLKRPPPDSVPNDVPPSKKLSSSPEIIELDSHEVKKTVAPAAKVAPPSPAISIETALKNVPELTVTMKPQPKSEANREKPSSGLGLLVHQLRAAIDVAVNQSNSDKRLTGQEKSSPLEVPWSRDISNLVEKNMDLLITKEGRLDKGIIESKILPLWPNSWMYRDNLYAHFKSILRRLISGTSKPPTASLPGSPATTITPIPPKPTKMSNSESSYSQGLQSHSRSQDQKDYQRDQKSVYRSESSGQVEDLLTQVIKEHLPSPKPSNSSRSSPGSLKPEPSRQLKLVPQEDLLPAKSSSSAPQLDSEASVQMEMRRVMQELVELNERRTVLSPSEAAAASSRMAGHLPAHYTDPYQQLLQQQRDNKHMELYSNTLQQMAKSSEFRAAAQQASAAGSAFMPSTIGFQEEFRRHLSSSRSTDSLFPPNLPTDFTKNWKF